MSDVLLGEVGWWWSCGDAHILGPGLWRVVWGLGRATWVPDMTCSWRIYQAALVCMVAASLAYAYVVPSKWKVFSSLMENRCFNNKCPACLLSYASVWCICMSCACTSVYLVILKLTLTDVALMRLDQFSNGRMPHTPT